MTPEIKLRSLELANRTIADRREVIARLRSGELPGYALVADPPPCLSTMFVFDLLRLLPRSGSGRVREINRLAVRDGINLAVPLSRLSEHRRHWLVSALRSVPPTGRPCTRPQG